MRREIKKELLMIGSIGNSRVNVGEKSIGKITQNIQKYRNRSESINLVHFL